MLIENFRQGDAYICTTLPTNLAKSEKLFPDFFCDFDTYNEVKD